VGAAFTLLQRGERADVKRADRFARQQDLWLPPEFARSVGARVRRREGLGQLLSGLVGAPLLAWSATEMLDHLDAPVSPGRMEFFPGPMLFAVLVLPLGLITVAVHLWDVSRAGRQSAMPAVAPAPARREQAVPPWLTWTTRCFAVLPPVVAVVVCALYGRTAQASLFAAFALAVGLATWGVEAGQQRVLNARPAPAAGPELAFDEAFRVTTVLSTVMTVPLLVSFTGAACCITLDGAGSWALLLFNGWTGIGVGGVFVVNAAVSAPGVRRYYRKRLPLFRVPETAPC
jgi:hypothetical protein